MRLISFIATLALYSCVDERSVNSRSVQDRTPVGHAQRNGQVPASPKTHWLRALSQRADSIVVGRLTSVDNTAVAGDGRRTTLTFRIVEQLKGAVASEVRLRFAAGYNRDGTLAHIAGPVEVIKGRPNALETGATFVLFNSRSDYENASAAEGRAPLPAHTQAIEIFVLLDGYATSIGDNSRYFALAKLREEVV
jgi:hypothetical protein